jgi:TBCC domain-containing protein 1
LLFVKQNLKLFLRLVSTDIHNNEVQLTANEFNSLRVIFKTKGPKGQPAPTLASLTPFYSQQSHSTKVHIDILQEWILRNLVQQDDDQFSKAPSSQIEFISFLNKAVTVRDQSDGNEVRISQCEDSYIYIGSYVESLSVSRCVNCTVFVAAVSKVCTIDRCENVTVCCASTFLRIGSCIDCTVYSYTSASPPVVFGDTRSLMLAPHNASFPDLAQKLKDAGIP